MIVAVMLATVSAAYAKIDCQTIRNGFGDMNLFTLGEEFTFAKPISIDLNPTNAPVGGAKYSIRCQIVYRDNTLSCPKTKDDKRAARKAGTYLNAWLKELFSSLYSGMEFVDLISLYYNGWISNDVKARFPEYVTERIEEMGADASLDIEIIAVTINAEDELKGVLSELYRQRATAPQK